MIQRIQSIYLLLTSLLSLLFLNGRFLNFFNKSGSEIYMNIRGIWESSAGGNPQMIISLIPFSLIILLICILSFLAIFLFKKRKLQLRFAGTVIFLTILFIGMMLYYIFWITGKFQSELVPVYRMFIPILILIFGILAYLGIKRDEKLVKSYDRLR
jgi:ABC-type transport system involved in cytochrome c biogenesis permease subunit